MIACACVATPPKSGRPEKWQATWPHAKGTPTGSGFTDYTRTWVHQERRTHMIAESMGKHRADEQPSAKEEVRGIGAEERGVRELDGDSGPGITL